MNKSEIVNYDSDECAKFVENISGWVSRHGHFYGTNEDLARYDGCTHRPCQKCGKPTTKTWLICDDCRHLGEIERYNNLQPLTEAQWIEFLKHHPNADVVYYSDAMDEYFFEWQDVEEYCEDTEATYSDLRLIWAGPEYVNIVDMENIFSDQFENYYEVPKELEHAVEALNAAIKKYNSKKVTSYYPSKYRVVV